MKRIIYLILMFLLCSFPVFAQPKLAPYLSTSIGATKLYAAKNFNEGDPIITSFTGAAGLQYKISKELSLRAEIEFGLLSAVTTSDKTDDYPFIYFENIYKYKQNSYMANLYLDRDRGWKFNPYGVIGFGLINLNESLDENTHDYGTGITNLDSFTNKTNSFGFLFGAGFSFNTIDSLKGDIGVRYMFVNKNETSVTLLSGNFGLRYAF